MNTKNIFQKTYTRGTTLIIQQLWTKIHNRLDEFNIKVTTAPTVVDYINNGVIEIWENTSVISHVKKELVKFCRAHPRRVLFLLENYQSELQPLKKIWKRGSLATKEELLEFINRVSDLMTGDLLISYLGEDARISGKIKETAARLRAEDHFFVNSNSVIRKSLLRIFPKLKSRVDVLRREDLNNPPSLKICRERFVNFICASNGYSGIQSLKDFAKKNKLIFKEDVAKRTRFGIIGSVANQGSAIGRAKIIFTTRDLIKVKKGNIIVSPMTTADMMPAVKRAAAIVTDEGGIICHATIVARELNIPCLVSTKSATKILKDGDLIEVDANNGIVKILKRA
ncbi:MAG: PEP-utilizing enzyme [bacterium]|nr:PEP-utilizing enzyme [bacterium]